MYGGRIIILGDSGEKVGEDMTGGHIFVGGKVQDLGSDAEQVDLDEGEDDDIRAFLDRYELRFTGTFTKIANPLKLSMPVMIAPMSYGALSASTKRAVGLASSLSGIAENTGEGGMSDA